MKKRIIEISWTVLFTCLFIQPTFACAPQPTYVEADGYNLTCYAKHTLTGKNVPVTGVKGSAMGHYGFSTHDSSGWPMIIFDEHLESLPKIISRFTYYHECAHLATPTPNEIIANCIALKKMRLNGDLKPEDEDVVAKFIMSFNKLPEEYGGSGKALWVATLKCADGEKLN